MNTILITGAAGFLGKELVAQLAKKGDARIFAFDLDKHKLKGLLSKYDHLYFFDFNDFINEKLLLNEVDYVIHSAFSRSQEGTALAESIKFTKDFYSQCKLNNVKGFVNISSQSVYGPPCKPLWKENAAVSITSLYALAKYSSELVIDDGKCGGNEDGIRSTSLRLASLLGPELEVRIVNRFVNKAINGEPIIIQGGEQKFSFMDVRDAADGIVQLLSTKENQWKRIYNFGSDSIFTLKQIAEMVQNVAKKHLNKKIKIEIEQGGNYFETGMDSSLFYEETGWKPKIKLEKTIECLFDAYLNDK